MVRRRRGPNSNIGNVRSGKSCDQDLHNQLVSTGGQELFWNDAAYELGVEQHILPNAGRLLEAPPAWPRGDNQDAC